MCDVPQGIGLEGGATWSREDVILFMSRHFTLHSVSAKGGMPDAGHDAGGRGNGPPLAVVSPRWTTLPLPGVEAAGSPESAARRFARWPLDVGRPRRVKRHLRRAGTCSS